MTDTTDARRFADKHLHLQFDAVLLNATLRENVLRGQIFLDRRGRFLDGKYVRTSEVQNYDADGRIMITRNTRYLVQTQGETAVADRQAPQEELLRVSTSDGKYTVVQPRDEQVRIDRYGEPWMGPGFQGSNAVLALGYELEEARQVGGKISAAARKLYLAGRWTAGLPGSLEASMWEDLRDALGIEPGTATSMGLAA